MIETLLKKNWRTAILLFVILWAWFVFPTPYKYYSDKDGDQYRRNRLTGTVESWYGSLGEFKIYSTDTWLAAQKIRKEKEAAAKAVISEKKNE